MVIKQKLQETMVYFPKNLVSIQIDHDLVLHSELSNETYTYTVNDMKAFDDYYVFQLDLTNIPNGEYVYTIDTNKAKGLIIIGDYTVETKEYFNEQKIKSYR